MKKETIQKLYCLRCKYSWFPLSPKRPEVCPRCNNKHWDKPKGYDLRKKKYRGLSH